MTVPLFHRADKSLFLERKEHATTADDYIAVSHVWGTPETITPTEVDGVAGLVQLSPGKKDILSILRREDVCGESWFWMDLFCIDQAETASISITDQLMGIPMVYKSSRCVKVLFEHPVCDAWHSSTLRVLSNLGRNLDVEGFKVEELAHTRRCPHLLFFDPWFERLWTRQEGLYGEILEIVVLNPVPCARLQDSSRNKVSGWIAEGSSLAKRTVAESFLYDKLAYHGVSLVNAEQGHFNLYLDLIYRHRLDISKYGGVRGPAPTYSPILEAWRSGRTTTKQRDYVLAVFPDISGYVVPPAARKKTLPELLEDALGQPPIRNRFDIVSKVPRGMMMEPKSLKDSMTSWIPPEPANVGEAYDTCVLWLRDQHTPAAKEKLTLITKQATLSNLELSMAGVSSLRELCTHSIDTVKHMMLVSITGPCTGVMREDVGTPRGLVQQYLVHQFAPVAVAQHLGPTGGMASLYLGSTGVISFDSVKDVPAGVFNEELRRYLPKPLNLSSIVEALRGHTDAAVVLRTPASFTPGLV
ncbi:hypothetical protein WOLCODRAFT_155621 [Wolfiporia cocos MD-104 SS10]|uniref:Heterokaryon incompatibility domain-containing protein n=1 Tax=Wolfiporia cocos (strain MD-104) TaxID=742152 RepID=A0A2H3JG43_WOLCO|nr:hypothetical protein WOLCODRAFT_155621 [Wolfiporia cocos MD-104 SS10]